MKKLTLLLSSFILPLLLLSQNLSDLKSMTPVYKGKIYFDDGTCVKFRNLTVPTDSTIHYSPGYGILTEAPVKTIFKISKTGTFAAEGAISFGLGALAGALQGTISWEKDSKLSSLKTPYIIGATITGAALGCLIGALIKKERAIYKNYSFL